MQGFEYKIERAKKARTAGSLLSPDDFAGKGSADSNQKALQALKNKGLIKAVAQGIYVRPKMNSYIGEVLQTIEEIAQAIAKSDKIQFVPKPINYSRIKQKETSL